ncbi:MAG: DNA-directed RNA polymerase subunit alpha, partial [Bacteroidota bacterium]
MTAGTIQMPERIQLDEASYSNTFGRFIMQPLEKGFGVTIGNTMRRVLLSSLPGYAITAFKVDGVQHEFSTIPGVVEDVPDVVLNLKQVRMKLVNKKTNRVIVPMHGPKEFTAGDIQTASPDVEILNPNLHIATLNADANFELDLRVGRGIGYMVADENKTPDMPVGLVTIDSVFSPVKNVRYFVETTRVGGQTDYEKLTVEVETDGSITPDDALAFGAKIARDHIQLFINFDMEPEAEQEGSAQDAEFER